METKMWSEFLVPYRLAVDELVVKFNHIIEGYRAMGQYSPIEQVIGRVKRISSIIEKAGKKGIPLYNVENNLEDIAGIRIICQFEDDIASVIKMIKNRSDLIVHEEKDYISHQKKSGYRSYHIIASYNVETLSGKKTVKVEIQIRTLAMNFWAIIEHSLQYKYKGNMPKNISERLQNAAAAIVQLDVEMSAIRNEIVDAQNSFRIRAGIVSQILNNIQNLYKVANDREVAKIQDEFYEIYAAGDLNTLIKFSKDLDVIAEGYRSQSLPERNL
ncbi:MAG: GTP pyrophosphokinase [Catonella sp.]|uniref:GTP pyrophosphokinase n=1 Tax=Catonella sp. TaxID=2382125 RepID=UPI003FA16856